MSTVRPDSQSQPVLQYGRKRSNTAQSLARMPPSTPGAPLKLGDSKVLNTWVHDPKESSKVIFNQSWWPGVAEGDLLRVTQSENTSGYLFIVPKDEGCPKPTLQANPPQFTASAPAHPRLFQISLPRNVADAFAMKNNTEVTVTKVHKIALHLYRLLTQMSR